MNESGLLVCSVSWRCQATRVSPGRRPSMELTPSFVEILQGFAGVFTAPSFQTFILLLSGWCLSHRHRFVTELIQSSGSVHNGHHSCYHRFFSHAAWSLDVLSRLLACLLVRTFVPTGLIELAIDDTL